MVRVAGKVTSDGNDRNDHMETRLKTYCSTPKGTHVANTFDACFTVHTKFLVMVFAFPEMRNQLVTWLLKQLLILTFCDQAIPKNIKSEVKSVTEGFTFPVVSDAKS